MKTKNGVFPAFTTYAWGQLWNCGPRSQRRKRKSVNRICNSIVIPFPTPQKAEELNGNPISYGCIFSNLALSFCITPCKGVVFLAAFLRVRTVFAFLVAVSRIRRCGDVLICNDVISTSIKDTSKEVRGVQPKLSEG